MITFYRQKYHFIRFFTKNLPKNKLFDKFFFLRKIFFFNYYIIHIEIKTLACLTIVLELKLKTI